MAQYLLEIREGLAKRMLDPEVEFVEIREVRSMRERLPERIKSATIRDIDGTMLDVEVVFDLETKRFLVGFTHDQFKRLTKRNPEVHTTFGMVVM